jgi:hypothetical protein
MELIIRRYHLNKWHGGTDPERNKVQGHIPIGAIYNSNSNSWVTGLSDEEEEIFSKKLGQNFFKTAPVAPNGLETAQISYYSKLTSYIDLFETYTLNINERYISFYNENKEPHVEDRFNFEDARWKSEDAYAFIKYKMILLSDYVALNIREIHGKPQARFYLENKFIEAQSNVQLKNEQYEIMDYLRSLERKQRIEVLLVLTGLDYSESSEIEIMNAIYTLGDKREYFPKINNLRKQTTSYLSILSYTNKFIAAGILGKNKGQYVYGEHVLGSTVEQVAAFLSQNEYKKLANSIMSSYRVATNSKEKEKEETV